MQRIARIVGSLIVVATSYVVYAATIERVVEPSIPRITGSGGPTPEEMEILKRKAEKQRADLGYWFQPDDWELDSPKMLETDAGRLLFHDYRPLEGGLVEIKPCSLVFLSQALKGDPESQKRRAFVLRAPQGALLRFDAPPDLKQARLGKLIGGELLGEVHIQSGQRLPGPEDDLTVTTRDVMLTETTITTPHLMEFRFGAHHGRGRGVIIELEQGAGSNAQTDVRGFKTLTLKEQVFMHLAPSDKNDFFPGAAGPAVAAAPQPAQKPAVDPNRVPAEIRCSGPFTFDHARNLAVFRNQVEVVRQLPTGVKDQINGDVMTIYFAATPANGEAAAPPPAAPGAVPISLTSKKLDPQRVEIAGEPVVIRAPSNDVQARAQYVEHDVTTRMVLLRDAVEAIVRQPGRELRAPELQMIPEPNGSWGTFTAVGRGHVHTASPDNPNQTFEADWSKRLFFRKHEGEYVLSAEGEARVASEGKNSLAADEIHVWFREVPKRPKGVMPATFLVPADEAGAKQKTDLEPDRLLALGNVKLESPQTTGDVQRLEGWFEMDAGTALEHRALYMPAGLLAATFRAVPAADPLRFPPVQPQPAAIPPPQPMTTPTYNAGPYPTGPAPQPLTGPNFGPVPYMAAGPQPAERVAAPPPEPSPYAVPAPTATLPAAGPAALIPIAGPANLPGGGLAVVPGDATLTAPPAYNLHGELLRLRIGIVGKKTEIREAVLERGVRLTERTTKSPDDIPLQIQGDRLHLTQKTPTHSYIVVTGEPAYVEARGMTMSGGKLTLDRPDPKTNLLGVDGQGIMNLPVESDLQGRPLAQPETLTLTWQGRLDFDGLTARFQRGVEGRTAAQYLRTDRLDVTFERPIGADSQPGIGAQPGVAARPDAKNELRRVECSGGVFLESRTIEMGQLKSVDRLTAREFQADRVTGNFTAAGPGEVHSVRIGKKGDAGLPGAAEPAAAAAPAADPNAEPVDEIQFLHVRFQHSLAGNHLRREMTFHNRVRVIRGPVADWNDTIDSDRPDQWNKDTVMIDSDRLQVIGKRDELTGGDLYDLVAEGNVLVEGNSFTSRSPRLTYDQAKGLLVIEGDARTDAVLYHQKRGGSQGQTSAKRFMVWPKTDRVQVDGASYLELTN